MTTLSKAALDAMTDQALAAAAEARAKDDPLTRVTLPVATEVAEVLAEQFAGDLLLAGRVATCVSQMLSGLVIRLQPEVEADKIGPIVANIVAFAAEQVAREGLADAAVRAVALSLFRVGGFDDEGMEPTEQVRVICTACGQQSGWLGCRDDGGLDRTAGLADVNAWAMGHECPEPAPEVTR